MIPIHFHAAWNVQVKKFQVTITFNERRFVEIMRPKRFEQFVRDTQSDKLVVGGTSIVFDDNKPIPRELVEYFGKVLKSYKDREAR